MTGPLLWYLTRGSAIVLLVLSTTTVVLGLLAVSRRRGVRLVPQFLVQGMHRTLSGLTVAMLLVHVGTAVVDSYVDIRWYDAIRPWGATYQPGYLALGAIALDLLVVLVVTSLLRARLQDRHWRWVHLVAYPSWAASVWHAVGIGTDLSAPWMRVLVAGCVVAVAVAGVIRLARIRGISPGQA